MATLYTQQVKFPLGMIIVLVLIVLDFIGTLSGIFRPGPPLGPGIPLGPFVLGGLLATLYIFIACAVLAVSFYGIIKRKKWAVIIIGWYIVQFVSGFSALYFSGPGVLEVAFFEPLLAFGLVLGFARTLFIIFYIYRKRTFLKN